VPRKKGYNDEAANVHKSAVCLKWDKAHNTARLLSRMADEIDRIKAQRVVHPVSTDQV
jgi:hypothetical protein